MQCLGNIPKLALNYLLSVVNYFVWEYHNTHGHIHTDVQIHTYTQTKMIKNMKEDNKALRSESEILVDNASVWSRFLCGLLQDSKCYFAALPLTVLFFFEYVIIRKNRETWSLDSSKLYRHLIIWGKKITVLLWNNHYNCSQ